MPSSQTQVFQPNLPKLNLIPGVKTQLRWLSAIPVCLSSPGLLWKKHHGRKVGLKQTPLRGHHLSPWTYRSLELDPTFLFFLLLFIKGVDTPHHNRWYLDELTHMCICVHVFTAEHKQTLYCAITFINPNLYIHYETFVRGLRGESATEPTGPI